MISLHSQGKPFNITGIQVYALTSNAEEAEVEQFYEDLQDLLELTPKKDVLFIIGDWNAKVGSQETWSNRQIWPWSTEWSRAKANRVLPRELTGHGKHPLPTTQEKTLQMDITRWSIAKWDWLYFLQPKMQKLYTVSKTRLGADCASDHELLIAKFRLKLKKVGKTTRPFRYDLNQILYSYTMEVRNRFKRLDLIEWLKNYGRRFVTLSVIKTILRKRKCKRQNSGLTDSWEKKRSERQSRKGKIYPSECSVPKNSKERLRKPSEVFNAKT